MNKFNKGKLIGVVAASLSAVSLMGVGFASWVLNGGDNKDVGNITISVAGTEDNSITFVDPLPHLTDDSIKFDAKNGDTTGPITWDGINSEKLNFTIEYTIKCVNTAKFGGVKAYMEIATPTTGAGKALAEAIGSKNYLFAPLSTDENSKTMIASKLDGKTEDANADGLTNKKYSTTVVAGVESTYTFTTVFSFNWGSHFEKKNPSEFAKKENFDDVKTALTELQAASTAAFTIHLEAVSTVTNA